MPISNLARIYTQAFHDFGEEYAKGLVNSLLKGDNSYTNQNYSYPYASYTEAKDLYLKYNGAWSEVQSNKSLIERILYEREKNDDERFYEKYLYEIDRKNSFDQKLTDMVGRPALNFVGGSIGAFVNAVDIAQGSKNLGAGLGQAYQNGGLNLESSLNILDGLLTILPVPLAVKLKGTGSGNISAGKGTTGNKVGNLEPGNPASTSIPRDGDRLVLNQGQLPTCGPNSCAMVMDTAGLKI